jgi:hypothetical protein
MATIGHVKDNNIASKDAADVTTSYGGWDFAFDASSFSKLALLLDYVHSDASSLQFVVEYSDTSGGTYRTVQDQSSGTLSDDEKSLSVSGDANVTLELDTRGAQFVRVRAKQTGGSATGNTLACTVVGGDY